MTTKEVMEYKNTLLKLKKSASEYQRLIDKYYTVKTEEEKKNERLNSIVECSKIYNEVKKYHRLSKIVK